jgi:hypothetical protein
MLDEQQNNLAKDDSDFAMGVNYGVASSSS